MYSSRSHPSQIVAAMARLETGKSSSHRNFFGATFRFESGAEVSSVKLSSDCSLVRLTNLPTRMTSRQLITHLSTLGFELSPAQITTRVLSDSSVVADVVGDSPRFAATFASVVNDVVLDGRLIKAKPLQLVEDIGQAGRSLQVCSVLCSWYRPSRTVWAHHQNVDEADKAAKLVNGRTLHGFTLACTFQIPFASCRKYSVKIDNVAALVTERELSTCFPTAFGYKFGPLSYALLADKGADVVKTIVSGAGKVSSFDVNDSHDSRYVKALARFSSPQQARLAVQTFDGRAVPRFGNSRLFLKLQVSANFKVLPDMCKALDPELNKLLVQGLLVHDVVMRIYDPTQAQQLVTLKIHSADANSVARVKILVETVLAGTIVVSEQRALWHDFFLSPSGLRYRKEIQKRHGIYVYADIKACPSLRLNLCAWPCPSTCVELSWMTIKACSSSRSGLPWDRRPVKWF